MLGLSSLALRLFVGRALLSISEANFMKVGALLFTLTSVGYLFAFPFWPLLVVRLFHGIGGALFYTASVTLIANISPETHRGQSLVYYYLAFNIAYALAPSLGMFIINNFNFTLLFLVCTGLSLCALFITAKLGKRQVHHVERLSKQKSAFFNRKILPPAIITFIAHIIWGSITAFFPLYALSHGVTNPGLFFAFFAGTLILSRILGAKLLNFYHKEKVILPCLVIYFLSMILLSFSKTLPMFILVAVIWGIGSAFLFPALTIYTLDLAESSPGPAMGLYTALQDLGMGLGPVIMGAVVRFTNYPIMFLCLSFIGLVNLIYFSFFIRKSKKPKMTI
jgi:MFS family permease